MPRKTLSAATEILHDYFAIKGGGEKLVLTLAQQLDLPITGGFVDKDNSFEQFSQLKLQSLNAHQYFMPLQLLSLIQRWSQYQPTAQQGFYSGVYAPLAINNSYAQHNVLYCHTPPRFIYDQKDYFLNQTTPLLRPLLRQFIHYFQPLYENALAQMDTVITNSKHVQHRLKKYLNTDSKVIYPPCDTQGFRYLGQSDYYLSTARLDGLKRVDSIIKAFLQMPDKKLVVTSGGVQAKKMRQLADGADNIHFTGWINDQQLKRWVGESIATLYLPRNEDFGISPVESMAAGKPVIGANEGGLIETIRHNETGLLLESTHLVDNIIQAVHQLDKQTAQGLRSNCERQAQQFTSELFIQHIEQHLIT